MPGNRTFERTQSLLLFIMLVLCTILHGYSVAHLYLPGINKVLSLIGVTVR
jgi:hypothetical protein